MVGANGNGNNGYRTQPMYSYREVSRFAHVSVSTVRNWLHGYTNTRGQAVAPLFPEHPQIEPASSFLQLIEIVVAARFRKAMKVRFDRVRAAYENARKLYSLEYPFASLELTAIGGHIVHIILVPDAGMQAIDQPELYTIPGLVQELIQHELEFDNELASRWHPLGKEIPIVVDPKVSAGLPVVEGRGVTVEAIYRRFKAGQETAFIANDYDMPSTLVEHAIRYREQVAV